MTLQNTSHAVMSQRVEPSDSLDFFPTPLWATRALCEQLPITLLDSVWEPACGQGHMSRALQEYFYHVFSSDIEDYGFGKVEDFLKPTTAAPDYIITNPPFNLAEQFALTALHRAEKGVALLVRTTFLEGVGRYERLFSKHPPTTVFQFAERVPMHKGRVLKHGSTATAYCWVVWRKNIKANETNVRWLAPCRKRLERDSDYLY